MKKFILGGLAALAFCAAPAWADLISTGGFESGFAGWSVVDQAGGSGSWFITGGGGAPISGIGIPAPAGGTLYAVTDQTGPGSHLLLQDFVVTPGSTNVI